MAISPNDAATCSVVIPLDECSSTVALGSFRCSVISAGGVLLFRVTTDAAAAAAAAAIAADSVI